MSQFSFLTVYLSFLRESNQNDFWNLKAVTSGLGEVFFFSLFFFYAVFFLTSVQEIGYLVTCVYTADREIVYLRK